MIAATERSNKELVALLQEARNMLNTRFGQISGSLANLEKKIDVAQAALLRRGDDFYTAYSFDGNFLAPVLSRIAVDIFWVPLAFCTSVTAVLQEPPSYILGNALGFSSVAYTYVLRRTFLAFARIFVLADFRLEIIGWQEP